MEEIQIRKSLTLRFKGNRSYVQGPDLYNASLEIVHAELGAKAWLDSIVFRGFSSRVTYALIGVEPSGQDKIVGSFNVILGQSSIKGQLVESDEEISDRTDYDESIIVDAATIQEKEISQRSSTPFSDIEEVVALTKKLHQMLFPLKEGKWIFSQLNLDVPLDSFEGYFKIKILRNLNGRFSISRISREGNIIGSIRFSVAKI